MFVNLEHYQITNSTSDFKSRTNDIFDKLINLEKQHDDQTKTQTPFLLSDEDVAASSKKNPSIPTHAITFKKRAADDNSETFTRPTNKWKKYDLDDVNEHHMSGRGNQHALNDFLRTRTKPVEEEAAAAAATPSSEQPVFKRPMKKEILTTEDDEQGFTPIRAPISTKSDETIRHDNDDETKEFKLTAIRKPTRGVFSTNEKKPVKTPMEITEEKSDDEEKEEDDEEEDDEDELFEP